jgi:hypothetical protein
MLKVLNVVKVHKGDCLWDICNAFRDRECQKPDRDASMVIAIKQYDPFQLVPR